MRHEVKILLLSGGIYLFAVGLFGPIYAVFTEEIGGDILTAGMTYAAFAIAAGLTTFLISRLGDKVKNIENLIIAGFSFGAIGFFGYTLVSKPWHLFIVQTILGLSAAIGAPAWDALYSKHLEKGKFVSGWGMWESVNWITAGAAAATGGLLAQVFGFKALFKIMFMLSLIALFIVILLKKRKP